MKVADLFEERLKNFLDPDEFRILQQGNSIQFSTKLTCIPPSVFLVAYHFKLDIDYIQVPCGSQDFTLISFVRSF